MGQEPEQIERHIHRTRARLEQNVGELQERVRSNLDWRNQFRRHTVAFTAAAFGGGLILALTLGRARQTAAVRRRALSGALLSDLASGEHSLRATARRASWDDILDTLIAMGPAQVRALFGELLPALRQYLARR